MRSTEIKLTMEFHQIPRERNYFRTCWGNYEPWTSINYYYYRITSSAAASIPQQKRWQLAAHFQLRCTAADTSFSSRAQLQFFTEAGEVLCESSFTDFNFQSSKERMLNTRNINNCTVRRCILPWPVRTISMDDGLKGGLVCLLALDLGPWTNIRAESREQRAETRERERVSNWFLNLQPVRFTVVMSNQRVAIELLNCSS